MKLKSKLTLLVGIAIAGGLAIVLILLGFLAPILEIQSEQSVITELKDAQNALGISLLNIESGIYKLKRTELDAALARSDEAFNAIEKLTQLPKTSEAIKEAVDTVGRLRNLQEGKIDLALGILSKIESEFISLTTIDLNFQLKILPDNYYVIKADRSNYFQAKVLQYEETASIILDPIL